MLLLGLFPDPFSEIQPGFHVQNCTIHQLPNLFTLLLSVTFFFFCSALLLDPLLQPFIVLSIFEIGFHELFAWAGFKPRSS
jgi:hypothetical protein